MAAALCSVLAPAFADDAATDLNNVAVKATRTSQAEADPRRNYTWDRAR